MQARFLLPLLLIAAHASAATLAVLPETSIQSKIDAATAGDIVAIFGGTYNEDITINKAIRLVEANGEQVILTGNVTFSGVTNAPGFEGFIVGSPNKGIIVNDTTGLVLKNVDTQAGFGIRVAGTSKCSVYGGTHSKIEQTGGILSTSSATIVGNFETSINAQKTVGFRTTVAGDVNWCSKKAWFGYSKARSFSFLGSESNVILVGTEIDRLNQEAYGMKLHGSNNRYLVTNCNIHDIRWYYRFSEEIGIWVAGVGNSAILQNNSFRMRWQEDYSGNYYSDSDAIRITDTTAVTIRNNIFYGCMYEINAPFGVAATNNLQWFSNQGNYGGFEIRGGVAPTNSLSADPLFVENQAPKLQAGSPCIDAGKLGPLYNDRDGSRNDIGPSGGVYFDPDGWTTDKPVVVSFDLSPERVLEGVDTEVVISNGIAISQP